MADDAQTSVYCPQCGAEVDPHAIFCPRCGGKL
ncbi:MAG: zinc-ribbon domain-containing protein [Ruthenibacterium lactatiformans]